MVPRAITGAATFALICASAASAKVNLNVTHFFLSGAATVTVNGQARSANAMPMDVGLVGASVALSDTRFGIADAAATMVYDPGSRRFSLSGTAAVLNANSASLTASIRTQTQVRNDGPNPVALSAIYSLEGISAGLLAYLGSNGFAASGSFVSLQGPSISIGDAGFNNGFQIANCVSDLTDLTRTTNCSAGSRSFAFRSLATIQPGELLSFRFDEVLEMKAVQQSFAGNQTTLSARLLSGRFDIAGVEILPPPPPAIPEPSSWVLLLAGSGAVGGALRHRRWASTCEQTSVRGSRNDNAFYQYPYGQRHIFCGQSLAIAHVPVSGGSSVAAGDQSGLATEPQRGSCRPNGRFPPVKSG